MNDHTKRIVKRIIDEITCYKQQEVSEEELMHNIEGHISAIEEYQIKEKLEDFVNKIEEVIFLFNEKEGRVFLLNEISKLKKYLNAS